MGLLVRCLTRSVLLHDAASRSREDSPYERVGPFDALYSESCAFDYGSVTFKESDSYVTVLPGRGPRCECFCRVVQRKSQRLKNLEHLLAIMR